MEITKARLEQLEKAERKLSALEGAGVDSWEGYDIALEEYQKEIEFEEKITQCFDEICEILGAHIEEPAGRGCGYGLKEEGIDKAFLILKKFIYEVRQ